MKLSQTNNYVGSLQFILILLFLLFSNSSVFADDLAKNSSVTNTNLNEPNKESVEDSKLLDQFIQSNGYVTPIFFDSTNIKQFWISKTVLSRNGLINILLQDAFKSDIFPFQLKNVDWSQDCRIDVISEASDLLFSVLDSKKKSISESTLSNNFLNYHVYTATFHLEDIITPSFALNFSSKTQKEVSIKKIILSFPKNPQTSVCYSPGTIHFSSAEVETKSTIESVLSDGFSVKGRQSVVVSKKKIVLSDTPISYSLSVKNTGSTDTRIYLGYAPYSKDGVFLNSTQYAYPYEKASHKVLSYDKENNRLIIDSVSNANAIRNQCLALNAKEDFSDIPNFDIFGRISEAKVLEDNTCEITLKAPATKDIPVGSFIRVHASGGTYPYIYNKILQPGEELNYTGTINKDDDAVTFSSNIVPKGVYYFVPVVLSFTEKSNDDNVVLIQDVSFEY